MNDADATKRLRVNFPPNPNPGRPKLVAPVGAWDTHFHVFVPHLFSYAQTRRYTPPAAPVEHFLAVSSAIGLSRGVVVQPSVHDLDTRVTVDAIAKSEGRLRGIIREDPGLSLQELKRLHSAGVRGVRFSAVRELGDEFEPETFRRVAALVQELGWSIELHLDEDALRRHVDLFGSVESPLLIDAWARIDPRTRAQNRTYPLLKSLLAKNNAYFKIIAVNRFVAKGVPYPDLVEMIRELIAQAPGRVIWGSDWPHADVFKPGMMPDDAGLLDMLLDFAPDERVRTEILVDTPRRLFDW
jgi:2-pyrone-4,6-dicarboxylate lactonase